MAEISRCEEDLKEIGDIPVEKNDDRLKMASDQDPVLRELISKDKDGDYCYGLSVNKLHQTCVYALSVDLDFGNEHIFCMARPGNTALN